MFFKTLSRMPNSKAMYSRIRMLSLLVVGVLVVLGTGSIYAQSFDIPTWVKNTALLWAQGDISDQDFVAVLQFLINEGIVTVPDDDVGEDSSVTVSSSVDNGQNECDEAQEPASAKITTVDATEEHTLTGGFDESSYNSCDPIRISFETNASQDVGIKIGVFNPIGDLIYDDVITADDFGIARSTFYLPKYYNIDENLEMIAFLQGDRDRKLTSTTTMAGLKTSLEVEKTTLPDTPHTAIIKLSSAVSEDVRVRIFDSNLELLHDETVTANDFGTASIEYTVPKYYLEDEMISIQASFVDDPDMVEMSATSVIQRTLVDVAISSDRPLYKNNDDAIVLTFTTDPPLTYNDLRIFSPSGHAGWCGDSRSYNVDIIEGVGTLETEISTVILTSTLGSSIHNCSPNFKVTSSGFTATNFEVPYEEWNR